LAVNLKIPNFCWILYCSGLVEQVLISLGVLVLLQGSVLSSEDICIAVFEQYLVADLCEIGASCLPADIVNHPKYTLTGCYGLQVGFTYYSLCCLCDLKSCSLGPTS